MRSLLVSVAFGLVCTSGVQAQHVDLEHERAELLRLHRSDRRAHFTTDVTLLQDRTPEIMISVSGGAVRRISRADQRSFFLEYFRDAVYEEWDDIEEPIIRVSADATMAWIIAHLNVRRVKRSGGVSNVEAFTYAGIMTYEKVDGRWMKVANVSTAVPRT